MDESALHTDIELQRILWACLDYWQRQACPVAERMVCHSWVIDRYRERFGGTLSPNTLRRLARLGYLRELHTVRGGSRRYYALVNPERVTDLLAGWGMVPSFTPVA